MRRIGPFAFALALVALPVAAQEAGVSFGGLRQDPGQPVEVSADSLQVSQTDGSAVFTGNVRIDQGEMRMEAGRVEVRYGGGDGGIESLHATEGVTLTAGSEAAEAQEALYTIASGAVVMTGDVLLTQGAATLSSDKLTIDLTTGTGTMDGRVRTVFQPGSK
jgi:lipopolysaccharide export system protein LptA